MSSAMRLECRARIDHWVSLLPDHHEVLDIGVAGDPKPGGNWDNFSNKNYQTMDLDARYGATYTDDICDPKVTPKEAFDVVILSNTLEHVLEPQQAIEGCYKLLKPGGYLIVDCPWQYPYHAADDFPDCWRISQDGLSHLLKKVGFEIIGIEMELMTSALARKI